MEKKAGEDGHEKSAGAFREECDAKYREFWAVYGPLKADLEKSARRFLTKRIRLMQAQTELDHIQHDLRRKLEAVRGMIRLFGTRMIMGSDIITFDEATGTFSVDHAEKLQSRPSRPKPEEARVEGR